MKPRPIILAIALAVLVTAWGATVVKPQPTPAAPSQLERVILLWVRATLGLLADTADVLAEPPTKGGC